MRQGHTIFSIQMSGLTSFTELLRKLRKTISNPLGLVTLNLRNSSQGWSQQYALIFDTAKPNTLTPRQLTLF